MPPLGGRSGRNTRLQCRTSPLKRVECTESKQFDRCVQERNLRELPFGEVASLWGGCPGVAPCKANGA